MVRDEEEFTIRTFWMTWTSIVLGLALLLGMGLAINACDQRNDDRSIERCIKTCGSSGVAEHGNGHGCTCKDDGKEKK